MNKIDKLDKELEKAREKAAEWQAKIRELEKQKQEEENSQIVQAVLLRFLGVCTSALAVCSALATTVASFLISFSVDIIKVIKRIII